MTSVQIIAGLLGVAALGMPRLGSAAVWVTGLWQGLRKPTPPLPTPREEAVTPSYSKAIDDLASVRTRLKVTSCLKEDQLKAVDVLTLALVAGSDQ